MGEKDYIGQPGDVLIDGYGYRKLEECLIDVSCLNLPAGAVLVDITTKAPGDNLRAHYFIPE